MTVNVNERMSVIKPIARKFFEEGREQVFVAECCGRLLVSAEPPVKCGTCEKPPEFKELRPTDLK